MDNFLYNYLGAAALKSTSNVKTTFTFRATKILQMLRSEDVGNLKHITSVFGGFSCFFCKSDKSWKVPQQLNFLLSDYKSKSRICFSQPCLTYSNVAFQNCHRSRDEGNSNILTFSICKNSKVELKSTPKYHIYLLNSFPSQFSRKLASKKAHLWQKASL